MKSISNEMKTGFLVALSGFLLIFFAWVMGVQSPFRSYFSFYVVYSFAGGIDVGSPVRLSGIKVGKVESIEFFADAPELLNKLAPAKSLDATRAIVPLKVKIAVSKKAQQGIRKDSQFFINLAGLIGERYIEITPGHTNFAAIEENETLLGIDPPRIDQLLSQSFDLAGKIMQVIEENKGDVSKTLDLLFKLSSNLNQTLAWVDKSRLFKSDLSHLVGNVTDLTSDLKQLTQNMNATLNATETKQLMSLVRELVTRLKPVDGDLLKEFFQKQGIKVQIF